MTWKELVEKVKNLEHITINADDSIVLGDDENFYFVFSKSGRIRVYDGYIDEKLDISYDRSPDQMYVIITALTETKE